MRAGRAFQVKRVARGRSLRRDGGHSLGGQDSEEGEEPEMGLDDRHPLASL